ncbi:zinc finger matrin-type protein CG9776 [Plodia interpunctella]|uniref:zinc finger matrin-type protein CG9776 n=1 Tax=Plodia interpunctella TaxID=58824 RepID=UPI002368D3DA|nr:zinc finger matrin-type protein CG9776 [Plodia interpunctella]
MSRDPRDPRNKYLSNRDRERDRDHRDRPPIWGRSDYHRSRPLPRKRSRSRSPPTRELEKRRSRSPRKNDKDLDENILSEISKLPEPSELWDSQNQFGDGFGGPPAPGTFPPEGVPPSQFNPNYTSTYSGIYDDFPSLTSLPQSSHPAEMASWNQMSLPPAPAPPAFIPNVEDQIKKEAAIESEMRHQKAALSKQREDYIKKAGILKKELDTLKDQRNELRGDAKRSPSPDTKRFLKENTKLQLEIQNKLKTINNVVDMLNGIIGEEAHHHHEVHDSDDSDHGSKRKSRSPSNHKFNYVYYDPEMHWCRVCNEFPPTAKDYLNHLHSPAHHKMAAAHMEAPWHSVTGVNEGFPSLPSAPTKRTPIRGLQFFVPSTAWYCKLCDQFIGDLHCASAHLKSIIHSKNYQNFVEQNPHWETDWVSDRQKAFEKSRASKKETEKPQQYTSHTITFSKDGFHTKSKDLPPEDEKKKKKDKKKKAKRKPSSSSSSSDSSSSDSDTKKKKAKAKKPKAKGEKEKALSEFMSAIQMEILNENDRKLLNNIKNRMKSEKEQNEDKRERSVSVSTRKNRSPSSRRSRSPRRERDRSSPRSRHDRDRERERDREERRRDRTPPRDEKKPEIKKMPFIGKMPVYKNMVKNSKIEDQKKEELKKKDDEEEASKKRREEMDAEIQKKVAEFKEKIAKAQKERQQQLEMPPPALALPTALGSAQPAPSLPAPALPPVPTPQPSLPKDLQEALDIIFPSDVKPDLNQVSQDILAAMPPIPGFPLGMPAFPSIPLMQPQIPGMFSFDLNPTLFPPRPQLYDTHVPLVPSPKPRTQKHNNRNKNHDLKNVQVQKQKAAPAKALVKSEEAAKDARIKEELDDLAMLGIDASDVGAGM